MNRPLAIVSLDSFEVGIVPNGARRRSGTSRTKSPYGAR
jgi:hypothetical protein